MQDMGRRRNIARCEWVMVGLVGLVVLSGCDPGDGSDASHKINGSVHVETGKPADVAETINGNVDVANTAAVTTASSVNGSIHLGDHASADSLHTVNGNITIGAGARVAHNAEAVNGAVELRDAADVAGEVANVNGKIDIAAAHVGGGIQTVNGNISIYGTSRVEGGMWVKKATGSFIHFGNDVPRIEIGPGAVIQGDLRFDRAVSLYVSDRATIGAVTGATPIAFTGDKPPAG